LVFSLFVGSHPSALANIRRVPHGLAASSPLVPPCEYLISSPAAAVQALLSVDYWPAFNSRTYVETTIAFTLARRSPVVKRFVSQLWRPLTKSLVSAHVGPRWWDAGYGRKGVVLTAPRARRGYRTNALKHARSSPPAPSAGRGGCPPARGRLAGGLLESGRCSPFESGRISRFSTMT